MTSSGTYSFDPSLVDIVLDAFDRIQIRPAAITPDHMMSARRSLNQLQVRWSNNQVNLWTVVEESTLLNTGQAEYAVPANTVTMLDTWIRTYQMNASESTTPACSTTLGDSEVEVTLVDHGLQAGWYAVLPIYVSVGGLILQGTYPVVSVQSADVFTVDAGSNATATVVLGGAVPEYATVAASETVTTTLEDHGFVGGDTYTVHVLTEVGGLSLQGDYVVLTVPDADTLTFSAGEEAGTTDSAFENDGEMQVATQNGDVVPQDRVMTPMSRTDYAALPNKTQQGGYPTAYWFDRVDPPTVTVWQVPNGTLVQEMHYFRARQLQDANPQEIETPDIPYRFEEALCAGLAYLLAVKWKPDAAEALKTYYGEVFEEAISEDRERVTLNALPQTTGYYQ